MKRIIELTIMLMLLLTANLFAQKYMGNIHKYLFEEGVKLLEYYKVYEQYQEYNDGFENPRYNEMRNGSAEEDDCDWIYGYGAPGGPEVYITEVVDPAEWIIEYFIKSITHFWDADNFVVNETEGHNIVSGYAAGDEYIIHNIPSAVTKIYRAINGFFDMGQYHFQTIIYDGEPNQTFDLVFGPDITIDCSTGDYIIGILSWADLYTNEMFESPIWVKPHICYIVGTVGSGGQTIFPEPYLIRLTPEGYNPSCDHWDDFNSQYPYLKYAYIGRAIHLLEDMCVPAHVHNDNHGPDLDLGGMETENCDQYEGWDDWYGQGGYLQNNLDNVYWDADMTFQEYGGLIEVPSDYDESRFLFDLFYSINQVTDMFASDDLDGDCDSHPDFPFSEYSFIQEMQNKFEDEILPNFPNIQSAHEITDTGEREAIRDICIPNAIRGIATLLEYFAKKMELTPAQINYRKIYGSVELESTRTPGVLGVSITFVNTENGDSFVIHPHCKDPFNDNKGWYSTTLYEHLDQLGTYDIIYSLVNYATVTLNDIEINGSEDELHLPDVILEPYSNISGHITLSGGDDNARPVTDVTIKAGDYSTNPDENGDYVLQVTIGTYDVKAFLPAYSFGIENGIVVEEGEPVTVDFTLHYAGYIFVSQDEDWHFSTIQDGIYAAQDGETVLVDDGIYSNDSVFWVTLPDFPNHITVKSLYGPENCIIDEGNINFSYFDYNSSDIIDGFTIQNSCIGITIESGSPVIRNNIIKGCTEHGIKIEECSSYTPVIKNNIIKECGDDTQSGNGAGIYCKSSATIKYNIIENNINFWNAPYNGNYGGGLYIENNTANPVKIIGNTIRGNMAFEGGAIYATGTGKIIIDNNEITENSLIGMGYAWLGDCEGICCKECDDLLLSNNLIHHNIEAPIAGENTIFYYNSNVEMFNNTVANNDGQVAIISYNNNSCILTNNIVVNNRWGIYRQSGPHPIITYCDFWGNEENYHGTNPGENCISEDPYFAEPANGDYSLTWNIDARSPCIDTGDPDEQYNDPDGTRSDMGAIPAIWHKYDKWELPPNSVDDGWKWMSFPALDDLTNADDFDGDMAQYMLEDILDYTILDSVIWKPILIQNSDLWKIKYENGVWTHLNHIFTSPQGYKFNMSDNLGDYVDLELSGFLEDPDTEIDLWGNLEDNWIGYFLEETQTIEDAFGSAMDNIYSIQMQHWEMRRQEKEPGAPWIIPKTKEEQTVQYGDMLIVQCFEEMDFQWNNNGNVPPHEETKTSYFTFSEQADYVPIYVELDPEDIPDEIGVLVDGECKGASVVEDTLSQICAYIIGCNGELEFELFYDNKGTDSNLNVKDYFVYNPVTKLKEKRTIKVDENREYYLVSFKADESETIPEHFSIQNFPNPFTHSTAINYALPQETDVTITIYNIKGQLVKRIVKGTQSPGIYNVIWNGKDETGNSISNGIYFYKLETDNKTIIKKMLLMR